MHCSSGFLGCLMTCKHKCLVHNKVIEYHIIFIHLIKNRFFIVFLLCKKQSFLPYFFECSGNRLNMPDNFLFSFKAKCWFFLQQNCSNCFCKRSLPTSLFFSSLVTMSEARIIWYVMFSLAWEYTVLSNNYYELLSMQY